MVTLKSTELIELRPSSAQSDNMNLHFHCELFVDICRGLNAILSSEGAKSAGMLVMIHREA